VRAGAGAVAAGAGLAAAGVGAGAAGSAMLVTSCLDAQAPAAQRLPQILDTVIPSDMDEVVQAFLFLTAKVDYQLYAPWLVKGVHVGSVSRRCA